MILLVVAAALPGFSLIILGGFDHQSLLREAARKEALSLARITAAEQERRLESFHALMRSLLAAHRRGAAGTIDCAEIARLAVADRHGLANAGVARPDGSVACSGVPATAPVSFADREWFRTAVRSRSLTLADYLVGRIVNRPIIALALPGVAPGGEVDGVAFVAIDLQWVGSFLPRGSLRPGSILVVLDDELRVIAAFPDGEVPQGRLSSSADLEATRAIDDASGTADIRDLRGDRRDGAYAQVVVGSPPKRLTFFVGMDDGAVVGGSRRLTLLLILGVVGATGAAIGLAWFAGGRFVVRPARAIAGTARRIAAGDLTARSGLRHGNDELGKLAADVDHMAATLEGQAAELRAQYDLYRTLVANVPTVVAVSFGPRDARTVVVHGDGGLGIEQAGARFTVAEWLQRIHEDDRPRAQAELAAAVDAGTVWESSFRLTGADGRQRWVRIMSRVVPGTDMRVSVLLDVSEQRKRSEELKLSAERIETLGDLARTIVEEGSVAVAAEGAVAAVRRLIPCRRVGVGLWRDEGTDWIVVHPAAAGTPTIPADQEQVARLGASIVRRGGTDLQLVPLRAHGAVLGVLAVECDHLVGGHDTETILGEVANLVALAAHRDRLMRTLRDQAGALERRGAALQSQTDLYRALVGNLPSVVAVADGPPEARTIRIEGDGGLGIEQAGATMPLAEWFRRVHPDDLERVMAEVEAARQSQSVWESTFRILGVDGAEHWAQINYRLIPGTTTGVAVILDVTDQVRRREELRRSTERIAVLGELARTIVSSDSIGKTASVAVAAVLRLVPAVRVGIGLWGDPALAPVAAHPAGAPLPVLSTDELLELRTGRRVTVDDAAAIRLLPLRAYGVSLGVLAVHAPAGSISSDDEEALGEVADLVAAAAHQDILVRALRDQARTLEERVAERTAELQAANAELGDFASVVAHDLRAPLRSMRGFSEALLEDYGDALGDEGADFARRIVAAARAGDTLVADLLAYSRIGRAELEVVPVDLDGVADEVVQRLAAEISERDASVVIEGWLGRALGTRTLVVEALANLVENALKFADGAPVVAIRSERNGSIVRLVVDDNGIGVPPEKREQIWKVFERLHPHTEYPGTGIGLAIVAKAASRMGGEVGVAGRPGGGSSFWIALRAPDPASVQEKR